MFQMVDERELVQLEREARRPDYGVKYYKPATVLALIAELRKRQSMCKELELARRVADAALAVEIATGAIERVNREVDAGEPVYQPTIYLLLDAEGEAMNAVDDAVREYRGRVEAAAFLARPEVRGPLEKLGEMEERQ